MRMPRLIGDKLRTPHYGSSFATLPFRSFLIRYGPARSRTCTAEWAPVREGVSK
jgi:hypothetical protein